MEQEYVNQYIALYGIQSFTFLQVMMPNITHIVSVSRASQYHLDTQAHKDHP